MELVRNDKLTEQGNEIKNIFLSIENEQELNDFINRLYKEFGTEIATKFLNTIPMH